MYIHITLYRCLCVYRYRERTHTLVHRYIFLSSYVDLSPTPLPMTLALTWRRRVGTRTRVPMLLTHERRYRAGSVLLSARGTVARGHRRAPTPVSAWLSPTVCSVSVFVARRRRRTATDRRERARRAGPSLRLTDRTDTRRRGARVWAARLQLLPLSLGLAWRRREVALLVSACRSSAARRH